MYRFCENLLQDKLIILHASLFINIGRAGRLKYYRTYLALSTCPDCGAQRALHAVPHPDIAEAIRYNLFHYRLQIVVFFFCYLCAVKSGDLFFIGLTFYVFGLSQILSRGLAKGRFFQNKVQRAEASTYRPGFGQIDISNETRIFQIHQEMRNFMAGLHPPPCC